jgi:hypothetical protein
MGNDLEGNDRGLVKALFWHLPRKPVNIHENPQIDI